ncbi:hypothetical protein ACG0TE_07670, partial [Klebsiella pneumoniae]
KPLARVKDWIMQGLLLTDKEPREAIKLLKNGYRSRTEIAHFVSRLEEKEYTKIFYQKSATLNLDKPQEAELFLSALQQANLIKKWTLRDVGKYYVQCRYEEDESYLD